MDAISPRTAEAGLSAPALPPEAPLAMPRQSLRVAPEPAVTPARPRLLALRRFFIFGATLALTGVGAWQMYEVLAVGGLTFLEKIILALFIALFAWIALSFVSSLAGFAVLLFGRSVTLGVDPAAPLPPLNCKTALLLPTYNEDPHRVFARLQAIYESVRDTGRLASFDFFVLSDSTDPAIWLAEETCFLRLRAELGTERLFYRHRQKNVERKAGNIADWVMRFGGGYEHMIVLDADSLMEGGTVVRLAAAMEGHPHVALIQTLPQLLNARTLFARLQQFAGAVYGPVLAYGIAWWHGSEGNYWGHNAIIRVRAFASSAGLPVLRGGRVFGGHILSHDFVEAAFMRRAGWASHMAPELGGSYEECPPTLTDYAVRDRRWCQGNLQHAGVLPARGLHWVSRLHLLTGMGSYLTAPLWLIFLLAGVLISLQAEYVRPEYFPKGATLFPQWPAQDPVRAAYVFAGTMAMLLLPKLIGWLAACARRGTRYDMGGIVRGFVSMLVEIVISALIAPIMMLKQCRAVGEILLGRDAGWSAQRRDDSESLWAEAVRSYSLSTVIGLVFVGVAYAVSTALLIWMLPVIAGLVLAIPVVWLTGRPRFGERLRRMGLLLTGEERRPPKLLVRANELASQSEGDAEGAVLRLLSDRAFRDAHIQMLGQSAHRAKGDIDVPLVVALAKIDDAEDPQDALAMMDRKEVFALLSNRDAIERLMSKGELRESRTGTWG
jgi:membrane glycosyltransferase